MARLSGTWTLRCIEKESGWSQGIMISGSNAHDGIHEMVIGDEIQGVQGEEMTLTPQALNPALGWIDSLQEERAAWDDAVGMTLTISGDDNPPLGDRDFNDLVVLCLPEDPDLVSPLAGFPRPDLTIPEGKVHFESQDTEGIDGRQYPG